jgi:hypothetical protein
MSTKPSWYFPIASITALVSGYQYGRYELRGTLFGYKMPRYYKLKERKALIKDNVKN